MRYIRYQSYIGTAGAAPQIHIQTLAKQHKTFVRFIFLKPDLVQVFKDESFLLTIYFGKGFFR